MSEHKTSKLDKSKKTSQEHPRPLSGEVDVGVSEDAYRQAPLLYASRKARSASNEDSSPSSQLSAR